MEAIKQKYDVFAKVTLPVSFEVEASDEKEALDNIQQVINDLNVLEAILTFIRLDGKRFSPYVHDWEIEFEEAIED